MFIIMSFSFTKMHGAGNDFAIIDARAHDIALDAATLANRHTGIGADQVIVLKKSANADAFMQIFNADGSEVAACGNASRCVGQLLAAELNADELVIETKAGLLECRRDAGGLITVDMGLVRFDWREIPLASPQDTAALSFPGLPQGMAINVGNPHCVFFVSDVAAIDLAGIGAALEHHPLFLERCNIEFAEITAPDTVRVRVWERGSGITLACGTGACAVGVAAFRRGLTGRRVSIDMDGGRLAVEYLKDGHVLLSGQTAISFTGVWHGH
jgi:diaminopimelate epimerase